MLRPQSLHSDLGVRVPLCGYTDHSQAHHWLPSAPSCEWQLSIMQPAPHQNSDCSRHLFKGQRSVQRLMVSANDDNWKYRQCTMYSFVLKAGPSSLFHDFYCFIGQFLLSKSFICFYNYSTICACIIMNIILYLVQWVHPCVCLWGVENGGQFSQWAHLCG